MSAPVPASVGSSSAPLDSTARELHIEQLVGHHLRDESGESLGRIEEIVAERRGTDWCVVEIHVGPGALLERLVELTTLVPMLGAVQRRLQKRYRVPWHQLDLMDERNPRTTVRRADLERIDR
jgi:ribosomal 30S subunit maturation factor RimM